jgi:hypothetical protein
LTGIITVENIHPNGQASVKLTLTSDQNAAADCRQQVSTTRQPSNSHAGGQTASTDRNAMQSSNSERPGDHDTNRNDQAPQSDTRCNHSAPAPQHLKSKVMSPGAQGTIQRVTDSKRDFRKELQQMEGSHSACVEPISARQQSIGLKTSDTQAETSPLEQCSSLSSAPSSKQQDREP